MKFEVETYKEHKYIHYIDEENNLDFTNSEYFIFDVTSEEFKDIMSTTGGFVAEMTTRMIKTLELPCTSIMLCQTPHNNNTFQFQFVYLDEYRNVLNIEWSNNYYDYQYFYKKFSSCIIEKGCIFDLLQYKNLYEVTKEFKTPTTHFNIIVDGKEITPEDTIVCEDLCFLKKEYAEKFIKYGVIKAELKYDYDFLNASHFKARFIKKDGSFLLDWQGRYEFETIEEFRNKYGKEDEQDMEIFVTSISTSIIRHLVDHFKLKS